MQTLNIKFYDYYGNLYNQQNIEINSEEILLDWDLNDLIEFGVIVPTLPDVQNKSFLGWTKRTSRYE